MKRKRRKAGILDLIEKMKLPAGIGAESPECAGMCGDGLVADSPMARLATAAQILNCKRLRTNNE
jgi:hypothetical protein